MKTIFILILVLFFNISHAQYLQFIENKGQWDKEVKFKSDLSGGALFLQATGYKVVLHNKDEEKAYAEFLSGHKDSLEKNLPSNVKNFLIHSHAYQLNFLNANENAQIEPDKPLSIYNNYFIGSDSTKWATGCKIYNGVTYKNVYKNVDVRYYSDNGNLKYDLIINPGADLSKLAIKFSGLEKLLVNKYGNLTMQTSLGEIYQTIPDCYQVVNNVRAKVKAAFEVKDSTVHFKLGRYDKTKTIIIDPTEIFSTFVGSLSDVWGYTATYDNAGDFYAGGIVFGSGFTTRVGGYDDTYNGGDESEGSTVACDVSIIKFDPTGRLALFATYLGGSGDETPNSLVVDTRGNLIVAGRTTSPDFPVTVGTYGAGGGFDIYLAKLSSDGQNLLASRKFGGKGADGVNEQPKYVSEGILGTRRNYGDDSRSEVITDNSDNIYLASCTQSSDFPTTSNAFKKALGGNQDGVLIKASTDLQTVYTSTLIGGSKDDVAIVLSISNASGNIYIGGGTQSSDMAFNATDAPQGILHKTYQGGDCDGFVTEISGDGSKLIKTSYVGTKGNDMVYGLKTDKYGYPYVTGTTTQSFPIYKSPFNANGNQANGNQFISKLNPDLTQIEYSANFGKGTGIPDISPTAFLVDVCGNVYVSGWGGLGNSSYYKTQTVLGMVTTSNALSRTTDGSDFYFFVLEKNANSQLFGSFFGQNDPEAYPDHVDGGTSRFDARGVIYQAVCANCEKTGRTPFPTTSGSWSPGNPAVTGARCNEAAVKIAFEFSGVISSIRSSINGVIRDSAGCIPLTVDFADTIALGKLYKWNFGDGSPDTTTTTPTISHTYFDVGNYRIMLISIDSSTCNIADTAYMVVKAKSNKAPVSFTVQKLPPCESLTFQFNNTSVPPNGFSFGANDFTWDFGDGTPAIVSNAPSLTHQYAAPGTYKVRLYLNDTTFCNSPDSAVLQFRVASILVAQFQTPPTGCAPYNAYFDNTSLAGQQFVWDFGDGSPVSTEISPTHLYSNPGTYTIHLSATDTFTCNKNDDTTITIVVYGAPTASYTYTPDQPKENTPYVFTNTSVGAVSYKWKFGDGDTLVTNNQLPVTHIYNTSGNYNACLIAFNQNGCADTTCDTLSAIVFPLVDVPNAFSPNGDGINDVIYVQGYGISKMTWSIYNRWGQLVFRSSGLSAGWDGKYKGVLQPQDVYAYTLDITFTDNTQYRKKGDITLLR